MSADHGGLFTVPIGECSWKPLYTDAAAATSSIETSERLRRWEAYSLRGALWVLI